MKHLVEVCCGDPESVLAAAEGGALRIELCQGLECGGLTPSKSLIDFAVSLGGPKVNVLIRPRSGDFVYTSDELAVIAADARDALNRGANAVVTGMLNADGTVNVEALRTIWEDTDRSRITFHRAIDLCADPMEAMEAIRPYCARVLTSGQAATAFAGAATIREMVSRSRGEITVMAGGGITADNIAEVARLTGAPELHGTFSTMVESRMTFRRPGVSMGTPGTDEYMRKTTSRSLVEKALKALR